MMVPSTRTRMSANDIIALEANFKNWERERADGMPDKVKPWVYYCVDQYLRPFNLSDEETLSGIMDKGDDGGVDAFHFFINGNLVDSTSIVDEKALNPKVDLVIIQVTARGGFSPLEVNKHELFSRDLFPLNEPASKFKTKYHDTLLKAMKLFKETYLKIAGNFPTLTVQYYYIANIDEEKANKNVRDAIDNVEVELKKHFSAAAFKYDCENAQKLSKQVQTRISKRKTLIWAEPPMESAAGYVGLVRLKDYVAFIQTDSGTLAEHMLDANVRGYQGDVTVNKQIKETLQNQSDANFWILNNGITVLASGVPQSAGHLRLDLEDPQIVNGLQTSREIFNHFSSLPHYTNDERSILVRLITATDPLLQDAIIRATNSQTKLPEGALRITDRIHHQIEDLFKTEGLYYDRRKGFYKDTGKPIAKIISVTQLIQAVAAIYLQSPYDARWRPSDYLTKSASYEKAFNEDLPLTVYLKCILIMRKVQDFVRSLDLNRSEKFNLKLYIAMCSVCLVTHSVKPSAEEIVNLDLDSLTDEIIGESAKKVLKFYSELKTDEDKVRSEKLSDRLKKYLNMSLARRPKTVINDVTQKKKNRAGRVRV